MGILDRLKREEPEQLDLASSGLQTGRFGTQRYQPPGAWVQATPLIAVAGVSHRKMQVLAFFGAVQAAERAGKYYGVELRPDPDNEHDRCAIAVDGIVADRRWHLGFLDRDTAKDIHQDLIACNVPITGEIYNLWASDDGYLEVKIFVLASPGHGVKARVKRSKPPA